ncbi:MULTISPECIES: RNA-guided endonuclease InsQ/TnpB family protein [unclassified Streptomyces]|uniref:RNA-guided endonuclease InsQ/TnpB family protein n=1 Tax=unclassified Streptomyces TaxID=2593676 RepID=UPI000DAEDF83|nr:MULTISPECIES: RNA-guided endonuclease TnpB family protein [unclassified Streptomyces]PZT76732.1 transposase [Streptomyces sp. AC1-42W]PZT79313.1 transposase [Streptomyces sp. AC1-42T]
MMTMQETGEESGRARYTYRLRVSSTARTALEAEWARCRWIWNESVARSKKAHAQDEKCGPARLDKMLTEARGANAWLREGSSVPQQQLIRDFAKSRAKALKDIKARVPMVRRAGMPRYKKKRGAEPSLNYTRRGFRLKDGRLHLAGGTVVTVVWSRQLPAVPSSVRIYRDGLGHWYASFVVAVATEPLPATGAVIGIDWGVRETATTTSDRHDLPHPRHGKTAAARLARYQKRMARRKPARGKAVSRGYRMASRAVAKVHKKVARQRQDTARKWAKAVVRNFDQLAVEDFKPKFLAKSTMARKAADAAIGATRTALTEMARKHGRIVHLVHPAHTTMDCSQCGARTKHALPLSERTYACTVCGVVSPRDKNSARVMLVRAGLNPASADGGSPRGAPLPEAA